MLATTDVGVIMIQSNSQNLGQIAVDSAPFPGPAQANWVVRVKSVFDNVFGRKATGPVAIPCGMNGCNLYVGEHEIQF